MNKIIFKFAMLPASLLVLLPAYAATPVELMNQPVSTINHFFSPASSMQFMELNRSIDKKHTLHVRVQQTYSGYTVWGADTVVHIPNGEKTGNSISAVIAAALSNAGFMNGTLYQNINADLVNTPAIVFSNTQADQALQHAITNYQQTIGSKVDVNDQESKLIVYIDDNNKAHWAFKVSFFADAVKSGATPTKPMVIMDAVSFQVYEQWNNLKTEDALAGGFGGNKKMGERTYDGLPNDLAKLKVTYDATTHTCQLMNADVTVKSAKNNKVESFDCTATNPDHDNVYWDGDTDAVHGGYSPANDALFGGAVIKSMYKDWYSLEVLTNPDSTPMMLNMLVHKNMDNAYWDGKKMVFGDGIVMFYPLTSLGVAAHEISHGFTEQHSNLTYTHQTGGMNESFSDMAAQAAEVYAYGVGKNSWQIGPEIFKHKNQALRYMDKPSKDCKGGQPGDECSIDDASQYNKNLDVHFTSGVYNHFFYILGTTEGWDAKKAFDVMVLANQNYWTSNTNYKKGACGVISAATDLGYDVAAVKAAFDAVKVDYSGCKASKA